MLAESLEQEKKIISECLKPLAKPAEQILFSEGVTYAMLENEIGLCKIFIISPAKNGTTGSVWSSVQTVILPVREYTKRLTD